MPITNAVPKVADHRPARQLSVRKLDADRHRTRADVNPEHRSDVGHRRRLRRVQTRDQFMGHLIRGVEVLPMMNRDDAVRSPTSATTCSTIASSALLAVRTRCASTSRPSGSMRSNGLIARAVLNHDAAVPILPPRRRLSNRCKTT